MQPDLILLDIGLPTINGIEACRRIRKVSPASRILFVSENQSAEVAQEALSTGASGYVVKSDAASELARAVSAVLEGKRFISASLSGHKLTRPPNPQTGARFREHVVELISPRGLAGAGHHQVGFYSEDLHFLDDVTRFIGTNLRAGNAAIAVATELHLTGLLPRLRGQGADIAATIEQGRFIAVNAADALLTFMIDGRLDSARYLNLFRDLIMRAADAMKGKQGRVALFGEGVHLLSAQGNAEAMIQAEGLCNQLATAYDVDILCGYSLRSVQGGLESPLYQTICAEHSAVYSR